MIYEFELEHGMGEFLFERISDANYKFGTKKCTAKISNGVCLIRVGGGYMDLAVFYATYAQQERDKKARLMAEMGTAISAAAAIGKMKPAKRSGSNSVTRRKGDASSSVTSDNVFR